MSVSSGVVMVDVVRFVVFPSELGWMGLAGTGDRLQRLTFGHETAAAAKRELQLPARSAVRDDIWNGELVERLQAYARGAREDFRDVQIDEAGFSDFQRRVVDQCRRIPPGATISYGRLAQLAGKAGAARAVGNVMRTNRMPLVVPCHRVVAAGGRLHGYSAAAGIVTKQKLIEMEVASWVWEGLTSAIEPT
jgi:methylated-DNA-[protein]-cysteine S-methyltransferase